MDNLGHNDSLLVDYYCSHRAKACAAGAVSDSAGGAGAH